LGINGERAHQLHTETLVWLRHPSQSQLLRIFLGRYTLADYEAADAGCGGENGVMAANLTTVETCAHGPTFVAQCSLIGLQNCLSLHWPFPLDMPSSPQKAYRSHYGSVKI